MIEYHHLGTLCIETDAVGREADGDAGRLFVKLRRDGHISVNDEDLGAVEQVFSNFSNAPSFTPKYKNENLPSEVSKEERQAKAKRLYSRGIIDEQTYKTLKTQIEEEN